MKRILPLAAAVFFISLLLILSSCGEKTETRILIQDASAAHDGSEVFFETFKYSVVINPSNGRTQEYTGYRLMIRDLSTGSVRCACPDPVCLHDIASGCPAVSDLTITGIVANGDDVLFFCTGQKPYSGGAGPGAKAFSESRNELRRLNLLTGEGTEVYSYESTRHSTMTARIGGGYVWYVTPDLADGVPVYDLVRYGLSDGQYKTIGVFEDDMDVCFLTDARVYVSRFFFSVQTPEDVGVVSFDYDGKNRRDEPYYFATATIYGETGFVARVYDDFPGGISPLTTPHFVYYNILTREYFELPAGKNAISIGYRKTDGRYYFISSEKAADYWRANPYYAIAELGITYEEYLSTEEFKKVEARMEDALSRDRMYLMSCDATGGDIRTHFEYPEGAFFSPAASTELYDPETGYVSPDGKWYYFSAVRFDTAGEKFGRINIETGEVEYPEGLGGEEFVLP